MVAATTTSSAADSGSLSSTVIAVIRPDTVEWSAAPTVTPPKNPGNARELGSTRLTSAAGSAGAYPKGEMADRLQRTSSASNCRRREDNDRPNIGALFPKTGW